MNAIAIGVALNNPLNIRRTTDVWLGMDITYTGAYCRFDSPEYCYRAASIILRGYERRGINTIAEAIAVWAPTGDGNPTAQYIQNVASWSGIAADQQTELASLPILRAMTRQESGSLPFPDSTIELGISMSAPQPED